SAGIKVLHKVPRVRFAVKAQEIGVDAVSIVGAECGGHPGLDMIGSFVQGAMAAEHLQIPYLIGGGVGTGAQLVAALSLGASGVVVGTRFLVAEEIWAHEKYKQALIDANERDTALVMHSVRNTIRAMRNNTTDAVAAIEAERPDVSIQDLMPLVSGKIGRRAYETGDWSKGLLSMGQSVVFAKEIRPLAEIVQQFEQEAEAALRRLDQQRLRQPEPA
ncbi:MAG: nitronate monooxygenase, partial [Fimbriimonadaceae bacterium]|nr:nitronate monooxygenase [Alphaproteobacteria bacterium]